MHRSDLTIRDGNVTDALWIANLIRERWGGIVVAGGEIHHPEELPSIVAERSGERVGCLTYRIHGDTLEVITLDALQTRTGVGRALVAAAMERCRRLRLITTNDNIPAQSLYQNLGLRLVAVNRGAIEHARRLKPSIPLIGIGGVAITDEMEYQWSTAELTIRPATIDDAGGIADIYNHYVANSVITFHEESVTPSEFGAKIVEADRASFPWLVAEVDGRVVGYAYAGRWKDRDAYRFSAEVTVYLDHQEVGRGTGSRLYGKLFQILQTMGVHAIMAGIALPNDASVSLHEKFGMVKVAHFCEVGFKFNRWIDVGYWQRIME